MPIPPLPPSPKDSPLRRILESLAAEAQAEGHDPSWAEAEGVSRVLALRPALPAAEARRLVAELLAPARLGRGRHRAPPQHLLQALARPAVPRRRIIVTRGAAPQGDADPEAGS